MLIELLEFSGPKLFDYFNTVDLLKIDAGVSWISSEKLPNWMDIAREYTEHWLHQAQIRDALGAPLLVSKELFHPYLFQMAMDCIFCKIIQGELPSSKVYEDRAFLAFMDIQPVQVNVGNAVMRSD